MTMKEWNIEYYSEFSPTEEEVAHQDKLIRKALELITQGPDYFEEARDTLLEAGKVKHWDERIYNLEHGIRFPLILWYRKKDTWPADFEPEHREKMRKLAKKMAKNMIEAAKEELEKYTTQPLT
jgi:hypothetical protein